MNVGKTETDRQTWRERQREREVQGMSQASGRRWSHWQVWRQPQLGGAQDRSKGWGGGVGRERATESMYHCPQQL